MFCKHCGKELADNAVMCTNCGAPTNEGPKNVVPDGEVGEKSWLATLLLCILLGHLGVHSFYTGKIGIGLLQLFTLCGCGIWLWIDLIFIISDNYRDGEGKKLRH